MNERKIWLRMKHIKDDIIWAIFNNQVYATCIAGVLILLTITLVNC